MNFITHIFRRRCWLEVNLNTLTQNLLAIKKHVGAKTQVIAVIKANAYGHGAVKVAKHLEKQGVNTFAVACLNEAIELRENEITSQILILTHTDTQFAPLLLKHNFIQTVGSLDYANRLDKALADSNAPVKVHFKIDTGMSRLGFNCHTQQEKLELLQAYSIKNLAPVGIYSHFSSADDETEGAEEYSQMQLANFNSTLEFLKENNIPVGTRHCCNTGGTQRYPNAYFDAVRCGAALLGYNTAASPILSVTPIATLKTTINLIKTIPPTTAVSYSRKFIAEQPTKIATLTVGYADGYPRILSNRAKVLVGEQLAPQIGSICMDQMMIDVSNLDNPYVGQEVILISPDKRYHITADDLGALSNSCMHEILARLGQRIERVYLLK